MKPVQRLISGEAMYDITLKAFTGLIYLGRILLLVMIILFLVIFLFIYLTAVPGKSIYFEANNVEHAIWSRTAVKDIPFTETYGKDLAVVCVFSYSAGSVASMLERNKVVFTDVRHGVLEQSAFEMDYPGGLYRVVLVDGEGQAEIWKFDDRRFNVSFAAEQTSKLDPVDNGDDFGCVNAAAITYRVEQLPDGRYGLSVRVHEERKDE